MREKQERGWAPFAPTGLQSGVYGAVGGISEKSQNIGRKSGNMGKNSARGKRSAIQGQNGGVSLKSMPKSEVLDVLERWMERPVSIRAITNYELTKGCARSTPHMMTRLPISNLHN